MLLFGCSKVFLVVGVRHHQRRQLASKGWSVWSVPEINTDKFVSILLQYLLTLLVLSPLTLPYTKHRCSTSSTSELGRDDYSKKSSLSQIRHVVCFPGFVDRPSFKFFGSFSITILLFQLVCELSEHHKLWWWGWGGTITLRHKTTFSCSVPASFDV